MATITFYPLGNADCSLIEFADERLMLIDYFKGKENDDEEDKRVKLPEELSAVLEDKGRDYFDVLAFTHRDSDHVLGAEEFFWLDHAEEYQGEDRIKIKEIWVPACYILEERLKDSARIIRQEARHRLIEGKGIRVFSQPNALDDWLKSKNIKPKERKHLITTAGNCVPGFTKENDQAEIFIHAPFSFQVDNEEIDQNKASLVFHITFFEGDTCSRAFFSADTTYDVWEKIVYKTKQKNRIERLIWDIFSISHHCSYKALSNEKGKDKTEPTDDVKYLFEQGQDDCYLISSSKKIPEEDTDLPPHKQAAAYYEDVARDKSGEFLVTMSTPTSDKPKPIVIVVDESGPGFEDDGKGSKLSPGGYTKRRELSRIGGATFA
ncbi:MAG: hypothetical protein H8D56_18665 [Planctomycetes bacterium]|nr:hypothetical protein [Planctomycetota bacterium]MBL7145892.1 hypothetical protein [Phycisphaerae bacterium]